MAQAKAEEIIVAGEVVRLLPEHAVYWPSHRTLAVADLHWGKSEVFQAQGIPLPSTVLNADLQRLLSILQSTGATRLLILGDLIHATRGITPDVVNTVARWRDHFHGEVIVIRGNHDRRFLLPQIWHMHMYEDELVDMPFVFKHHPEVDSRGFVWCGHEHPVVRLSGGGDHLRLACFYLTQKLGILPSFGSATGGAEVEIERAERIFAIAGDVVVEV